MKITTAVIPIAGAGTRVFPSTTAIEKCMMPIYAGAQSRPVVDYMVEDCVRGGIKRIIFVTTERGKSQLKDYFEELNPNLVLQLKRLSKDELIEKEQARRRSYGLTYEYIVQPPDQYGTAYPPYLAKDLLSTEEGFALLGGDDFVYRQDSGSELADALELWEKSGTDHVIMGNPVPREEGPKYGILYSDTNGHLTNIDEKPPLERVPETPVANISRYILSSKIWEFIDTEMATERGTAEHYITYPINSALEAGQTFEVHRVSGKYLDGGSFDGLAAAGQWITDHPAN